MVCELKSLIFIKVYKEILKEIVDIFFVVIIFLLVDLKFMLLYKIIR